MTEMWDIARYVEDHPDDYEQRWRLAKKLYMAWEYRLALEHLQVLKNEWQKRINVVRYLAATYYRLGRYDEAISELQEAIEEWPGEIGLREQLARVLEIAGRREEGATAWEKIAELDPEHPIAASAAKRLRERSDEESPVQDLRLEDSDSGIDLSPGTVCPNCGAQNSNEFDRCWQCHAALFAPRSASATPRNRHRASEPILNPEALLLPVGGAALAFLSLAVFLSLRLLFAAEGDGIMRSFLDVYTRELVATRLFAGFALLLFWPASLWLGLKVVKGPEDPLPPLVNLSGVLVAAMAFSLTWLPGRLWYLALLLPGVLAFILILSVLRLKPARAAGVWAVQELALVVFMSIFVVGLERMQTGTIFNPFREVPAVITYTARPTESGLNRVGPGQLPLHASVTWHSTGSPWLDTRGGAIRFTIRLEEPVNDLYFEIKDPTGTLVYEPIQGSEMQYDYPVEAEVPYAIAVTGPHGGPGAATIDFDGLLIPEVAR